MLLIRMLLLWGGVSLHLLGGGVLFRRFFPRESPWLGFIVPGLALVLAMNFVEHLVALPTLLWLLPLTTLGCAWAILHRRADWKGLRLPTGIFLAAFAFTLTLRALRPDIVGERDGVSDLALMSSFCMGDKLPPRFSWFPPEPLSHYYALLHYAGSVLTRLFGLDVGTGFNLTSALLSAFDCLIAAATAWTLSRGKLWIAILAPVVMEGAGTGATVYLWLVAKHFYPNHAEEILSGMQAFPTEFPLSNWLYPTPWHSELMPPGSWSWVGSLHSTCGGLFLILLLTWSMVEVLQPRESNWPWICLGSIPLLSIVTSTWAVPLEILFMLGISFWVWRLGLRPQNWRFVVLGLVSVAVLLTPMLCEFLTTNPLFYIEWTRPYAHTQPAEFVLMWWPLYLPWFLLIFFWRKLNPAVKTVIVLSPIAFWCIETFTVDQRMDWTGKLWGYLYGIGWITLFPALCLQRGFLARGLLGLLLASSFFSFISWSQYTLNNRVDNDSLHLEGTGPYRWDETRGLLLQALSQIEGQTVITGRPSYQYADSPALAAFSGNRIYIAWTYFSGSTVGGTTYSEPYRRGKEVDDLYDGKCANPLLFLRTHSIAALVIFPGDKISSEVIDTLEKQLSPYYDYTDYSTPDVNAGIFIFHPELTVWPPEVLLPFPFNLTPDAPSPPISVSNKSR